MALEEMFEGNLGTGLLIGLGAIVLAPLAGQVLRPVAKAVIKGGMTIYRDTGLGDVAEDIVAEARAEIDEARRELGTRGNGGARRTRRNGPSRAEAH